MTVNKRTFEVRSRLTAVLVAFFVCVMLSSSLAIFFVMYHEKSETVTPRLNILFIVVDDLRPTLGCYGDDKAITPNIDQLARKSILYTNAYAQQAICGPSRTSFLTSRRPDTLHLYDNTGTYWRDAIWNFTTLPQHFMENGYEAISVGKVFHHGSVSGDSDDYPFSWSRRPFRPSTIKYKMSPVCPSADGNKYMNLVCPVDVAEQPGGTLPDLEVTEYAINYLMNKSKNTENDSSPFFLGVGFYKPHIPLKFPREYLDLYPVDYMDLAVNNTKPLDMPDVAWNPWMDLRLRHDVQMLNASFPYGPLPDDFQKLIRQGYYASISYMDEQLGRLLEALENSGYASNTAIMFIGDHGWSLGEHGEWSKYSNFDVSLRVPLMLHVPDKTERKDQRVKFEFKTANGSKANNNRRSYSAKFISHDFVELVDIFPTLSEVANISIPALCSLESNKTAFCTEGQSFYPTLEDKILPSLDFAWKTAVFSQYPRPSSKPSNNSDQPKLENIKIMGYSMKDEFFRYTRWVQFNNLLFVPHWSVFYAHELYDVNNDPREENNLADVPNYSETVNMLFKQLRWGWRRALPYNIYGSPNCKNNCTRKKTLNIKAVSLKSL